MGFYRIVMNGTVRVEVEEGFGFYCVFRDEFIDYYKMGRVELKYRTSYRQSRISVVFRPYEFISHSFRHEPPRGLSD